MIQNHSSNKLIIKAVASLNKAIKAHAYKAIYAGFKVKSKAQFIANVVSAKISLPSWWGVGSSRSAKQKAGEDLWNMKVHEHSSTGNGECNFVYIRPKKILGYGALLLAAEKLGQFSWADLLLSVPHHAKKVAAAYTAWGKYSGYTKFVTTSSGKSRKQYVSFDSYANNYFNSYRAYFVKNRILAKVKGKRGIYELTSNGKMLLAGMKELDTMKK